MAFIKLLTQRGILGDAEIDDDKIRQAQKEKKRHTYHNTEMLLQHYRDIVWALECFPSTIVEELDRPLDDLDALISYVDVEMSLDNRKLESRIESIKKSRLLLDRVNDALTILKKKPDSGEKMYELIYLTYIAPENCRILNCCTVLAFLRGTITGFASRHLEFFPFVCGRRR